MFRTKIINHTNIYVFQKAIPFFLYILPEPLYTIAHSGSFIISFSKIIWGCLPSHWCTKRLSSLTLNLFLLRAYLSGLTREICLLPDQDYRLCVTVPPNAFPQCSCCQGVVVCLCAFSWGSQMLLTDQPCLFKWNASFNCSLKSFELWSASMAHCSISKLTKKTLWESQKILVLTFAAEDVISTCFDGDESLYRHFILAFSS
jgi:hypothetical protein